MKRLLLTLALLAGCCQAVSAAYSGVQISGLPYTNNSPDAAQIIINQPYTGRPTNDTFRTSLSNLFNRSFLTLWTNISGTLQPTAGSDVLVTNLLSVASLTANGSFHISGLLVTNLVAGVNDLNIFQVGTIAATGPTTDPADASIQISTGIGYQLLFIRNNATNSAFTMQNGSPTWDDPSSVVHLNGDWVSTNKGDTLFLHHNGFFWAEVGRSWADTNIVGPAVMNPTDGFLPYRQSAGVFGDSPWYRVDANSAALVNNATNQIVLDGGVIPVLTLYGASGGKIQVPDSTLILSSLGSDWNLAGPGLLPQFDGSVIGSTTHPINGVTLNNIIWGDGGTAIGWANSVSDSFGNGNPEGVLASGLGSVYRNTNAVGTLWLKATGGDTDTGWIQLVGGGATINPTDGRVPYRTGATAFGDSPWFVHATNIMSFGSGTNQFLYQQDSDTFALGWKAAGDRILGNNNVAIGMQAMESADGQFQSVALGNYALKNNGGSDNTAVGHKALEAVNATALTSFGANNTAVGFEAMKDITNGFNNTSIGAESLQNVGNGIENTGLGYHAGDDFSGRNSVFVGARAGGYSSHTVLTNVGAIGYNINPTNNNDFLIGNSTNNVLIPGTLTVAGGITGSAANWSPSGTTNSLLVGNAFANGATFTNGITAGVSTFTDTLTITNGAIGTIPLTINGFTGQTADLQRWNVGGVQKAFISPSVFRLGSGVSFAVTQNGAAIGGNRSIILFDTGTPTIQVSGQLTFGQPTTETIWTRLSADAADILQVGLDSATATAQTFKGPDGSGTDKVGGALQLGGGKSTGTAAGGAVILHTANSAGASASTANSNSERFHAPAKWVTLTDATATMLFTIPVPATNYVGLTATVTIYATDGTDHQSQTTQITVDGVNKAGTITPACTPVAAQTGGALSSGTLSVTYTATDNGSNVLAVKANATSSLTETVLRAKIVITAINSNGAATVTEQ